LEQLILHVGLPKTGSTLLQKALHSQQPQLESAGWQVVPRGELDDLCKGELKRWRTEPNKTGRLDRAMDRIAAQFSDENKLIITHEDLLGHILSFQRGTPYPEAQVVLEQLLARLAPESVKVVIYLREQARYLESVYLQLIRVGNAYSFDEYMQGFDSPNCLAWLPLLERIESVVGKDAMIVRKFETIRHGAGPFCRKFLADLGISASKQLGFATTTVNRGYSAVALEIARTANPLLDDADQRTLRSFLDEHFSNRTHPPPQLLTDEQRDAIRTALQADNEAVQARYLAPPEEAGDKTHDEQDANKQDANKQAAGDEAAPEDGAAKDAAAEG
jgi:hypothetical protein